MDPSPPAAQVVDAAGALINLRTAIIRYRQPRSLDRFFRCVPGTAGRAAQEGLVPHIALRLPQRPSL